MLALILITVFLHLNPICNGQDVDGQNTAQFNDISGYEEGSRQVRDEEVLQDETTTTPESPLIDQAHLDGLIAEPQKVHVVQEDIGAHWPLGVIPYYFDAESYDHLIAERFQEALNEVESSSCIKFHGLVVKPTMNATWIHVTNRNHERACVHEPLVKETGEIELVLGLDCLKRREVLHSVLHALGFHDEVCHPQRDQYIRVLWENIQPDYRKLFRIKFDGETLMEYDPASIMHFHDRAFTMNGQATTAPVISGLQINPSSELSPLDKMKLRVLFGRECNKRKVGDLLDTCKNVLHNGQNDGQNVVLNEDRNKNQNEEQSGEGAKRPMNVLYNKDQKETKPTEKVPMKVLDEDGPVLSGQETQDRATVVLKLID